MSIDQYKRQLVELGVVHIPSVVSPDVVRHARDLVYSALSDQGLNPDNRWARPGAARWESHAYVKRLKKHHKLSAVISTGVETIVTTLAGSREFDTTARPQLLYSSPVADEWTIPNTVWHLDFPRLASGQTPGLQVFVCVDRVQPKGGGTLLVAGSHRLFNETGFIRSRDIKRRMRKLRYFQQLMSEGDPGERQKLLTARDHELGVPLSLVELTGHPGDIYVTDLRILHTVAPNAGPRPRIVMTQRYVYTDAMTEMLQHHASKRDLLTPA